MITLFDNYNGYDFNEMKELYIEILKDGLGVDELLGDISDDEVYDFINREIEMDVEQLHYDFDREIDEDILCIASLGLWYGQRRGYRELTNNLRSIFNVVQGDYQRIVFDRYNLTMSDTHHDGTNYYIFRKWKPNVNREVLLNKIYNGTDTKKDILRYTTSLKEDIKKIYGRV